MVGGDVILTSWTVRITNRAAYNVEEHQGVNKITNNIEVLPMGSLTCNSGQRQSLTTADVEPLLLGDGSDIKIVVKNSRSFCLGGSPEGRLDITNIH